MRMSRGLEVLFLEKCSHRLQMNFRDSSGLVSRVLKRGHQDARVEGARKSLFWVTLSQKISISTLSIAHLLCEVFRSLAKPHKPRVPPPMMPFRAQPPQVAFPLGLLLTTPSPCQRRAVARPTFTGPLGASAAKRNLLLPPRTSLSRKTTRMFFVSRCGECSFVSSSDSDTISSEPCLHLCKGNKDEKEKVHTTHHQESTVVPGSITEKDFGV
ncbi:uncharacterized protein LOC131999078 isoform X1 [Mustela nigripes]|uniref:uncharacterized protein LOC131999078 isoform X1 n=1 Tax=Mustela nigripes TaxID=77151 RepID=UPI002814B15C|nr:uncharacterized protein LOC131999078 isoform X1 [Mustela nigripes]